MQLRAQHYSPPKIRARPGARTTGTLYNNNKKKLHFKLIKEINK